MLWDCAWLPDGEHTVFVCDVCRWSDTAWNERWFKEKALVDYQLEAEFRRLNWWLRNGVPTTLGDSKWFSSAYPVIFRDTKTHDVIHDYTGKPGSAICMYCNRQIAAWGKQKARGRVRPPEVMMTAISDHTQPCAEAWGWRTMAAYTSQQLAEREHNIVSSWISLHKKNLLHSNDRWGALREATMILHMLKRCPAPMGTPIADAIEVAFVGIRAELERWGEWEPFEHGGDMQHPHIFNAPTDPTLHEHVPGPGGNAPILVGTCGCGERGPSGIRWSKEHGVLAAARIGILLAGRRPQ